MQARPGSPNRHTTIFTPPRVPVDAEGRIGKAEFEHYSRTLVDWSQEVGRRVDSRIVARQRLTSGSGAYAASGYSDMKLRNVQVTKGITYAIHLHTMATFATVDAADLWVLRCYIDEQPIGESFDLYRAPVGTYRRITDSTVYWDCDRNAKVDVALYLSNSFGGSTLEFAASSLTRRSLTMKDEGRAID